MAAKPDRVFLFSSGGPVVLLVWFDPNDASKPRLSLFEFSPYADVWKKGLFEWSDRARREAEAEARALAQQEGRAPIVKRAA